MANAQASTPGVQHFLVLDSLRGVSALIVVFYHLKNGNFLSNLLFARGGYMFVDFFFVLSGFVITWNYADRIRDGLSFGNFLIRRFFRLFPLHLFALLCYLVLELALMATQPPGTPMGTVSGRNAEDFVRTLLMMNSFGMDHQTSWNMPSWSISAEWWTYVAFGLLALLLAARGNLGWGMAALSALGAYVLVSNHDHLRVMADHGLFRCFYGFGLGSLFALSRHRIADWLARNGGLLAGAEVLLLLVIVWFVAEFRLSPISFLAPLLFLLTVVVYSQEVGPVSRLLRQPFFLRAGLLSYSIYLMHQLVIGRFRNVLTFGERHLGLDYSQIPFFPEIRTAIVLVAIWIVAGLTYRFVEKPGQVLGKRLAVAWVKRSAARTA